MGFLLSADAANEAFDRVEPMRSAPGVLKRPDGFVLVADASGRSDSYTSLNIVASRSYGNPHIWEHDFEDHCRSKADICWRSGLSSREAIHCRPWLLKPADSPWEGGIFMDDIIVAYSGAASEDDEAIAYAVMGWVRAHCFRQAVASGLWTPSRKNIGTF
jgi:hypothetical protein